MVAAFRRGFSGKFWAVVRLCLCSLGLLAGLASVARAQRLSGVAAPEHYWLKLTPNLQTAAFLGEERLQLSLHQSASEITLNAAQLQFDEVTVAAGGKTLRATVSLDATKEQATFHFPAVLAPGTYILNIRYRGILNDQLRGFYLSKAAGRRYAVTQFEPTDARRAFPCFDEPAYKAVFDITMVAPDGDTVISNTNVVSDTPGPGPGSHTFHFAPTPKMSTYLVAFLVGDFQCLSGSSDGVPIRVCATPDKVQYGRFALSGAEYFLHYYDNYFGIKYPMPKLDMIALPDFEAGAMENFGAITYRETALLVNPESASVDAQKNVAIDVAHEMSHQWFGDMVTMKWWDNLWLNEGFATWMENKPVAAWKPEWKIPDDVATQLNSTLNLDAQKVTRTIRAKADTPDEINEMFDGITYGKAGAVLLMVENYLGEEVFRQGVHRYLEAHLYGNATAEDFWNAQTEVSHRPVDKIMESLVAQPGEPLLTFGPVHEHTVNASQKRFFLNPKVTAPQPQLWTIPVCIKTGGAPQCEILDTQSQSLKVPAVPLFYANAGGKGYYRSRYDRVEYEGLLAGVETKLNPAERISLLGSEWALTRASDADIGDFLTLATAVKDDANADILYTVYVTLDAIDQRLVNAAASRKAWTAWVRDTYGPVLARMAPPAADDPPNKKELRAALFAIVGGIGEDPGVVAQAKQLASRSLQEPGSVDPSLADVALAVAARGGDGAFFGELQRVSETSNNPQVHSKTLYALTDFRNPALVKRAMAYAVSGKVRNQNSALLMVRELSDRATQDVAWQYIQDNWPKVSQQLTTTMGGYLVQSTGAFCNSERRDQITAFFTEHKVPAAARALERARNSISDCMELRATQEQKLMQWLKVE